MDKILAIVVTYNRKELLKECLESLTTQTCKLDRILVIDNASTDNSKEYIESSFNFADSHIEYITMEKNTGGAGGFYNGFKTAQNYDYDYLWVMDDDCIPEKDCLKYLNQAFKEVPDASFIASCIYGPNKEFMNVPKVDMSPSPNGYEGWYEKLDKGLVSIRNATFVSLLISRKAVDKCGFPCPDYFIWGDDTEYTQRIIKYYGKAYVTGKSIAIHKRANAKALTIANETDDNRIRMFRYFYRNTSINNLFYSGRKSHLRFSIRQLIKSWFLLFTKKGGLKWKAMHRGIYEALFNSRKFVDYIKSQLS